jgi:hypothetical protein
MKPGAACIALVVLLCGCGGGPSAHTAGNVPTATPPGVQQASIAAVAASATSLLAARSAASASSFTPTGTEIPEPTAAPLATSTPLPTNTPVPTSTPLPSPTAVPTATPAKPHFVVTRLSDVGFQAHGSGFQPNEVVTAHLARSDGAPCVWQGQPCIWQRQADAAGVYDHASDFSDVSTRGTFQYWIVGAKSGASNIETIEVIDSSIPNPTLPLAVQAEEHVLSRILNLLNSSQGTKGLRQSSLTSPVSYLETSTIQLGSGTGSTIGSDDIIEGTVPAASNYLHFRWYSESFGTFTNMGGLWRLVAGEAEIKGIRAEITQNRALSPADRANGLLWQGEVKVSYIVRYRAIVKTGPDYSRPPAPTQPYSPWLDDSTLGTAELRNGKWERVGGVNGVLLPVQAFMLGNLGVMYEETCQNEQRGCEFPPR